MFVSHKSPEIARILSVCGITGKRSDVIVEEFRGPLRVNSYWEGGSRDEYCLVDLETYKAWQVPASHPYFDRKSDGERCGMLELNELPPNTCLVHGGHFCGKPRHFTIQLRLENMQKLIPDSPGPTVSDCACDALVAIDSIKGGQYRRDEFSRRGLGLYHVDNPLIQELLQAGLVKANKRGAISVTLEGRNYRRDQK